MQTSEYVRKIVNEVVGKEFSQVDTTSPSYLSFLKGHTGGLSPDESDDFEISFRNNMQFIYDFKWCFLAIYLDYHNRRLTLPVRDVVKTTIGELVKVHYSALYTMIARDKGCQAFINTYVVKFKFLIKAPNAFDSVTFKKTGKTPVDEFAYVNAHQFVNVISGLGYVRRDMADELVSQKTNNAVNTFGDVADAATEEEQDLRDYPLEWRKQDQDIRDAIHKEDDRAEATTAGGDMRDHSIDDHTAAPLYRVIFKSTYMITKWGILSAPLILVLLTSYLATSSFNPVMVYRSNSLSAKIVISGLGALTMLLFLRVVPAIISKFLSPLLMRRSVAIGTGKPASLAICPSCGLSVFQKNDRLGLPIVCHTCHIAWHDGPTCYRRGMPASNAMLPSYPCPNCR